VSLLPPGSGLSVNFSVAVAAGPDYLSLSRSSRIHVSLFSFCGLITTAAPLKKCL
jgi:hypothetical protein